MDCMYSVWGSLELASKCQKPVVVTLLVWRLVAWGVLPSDLGWARNSISWVVARDGGWTRGTLELWLGLASFASVSVLVVASTDGSKYISLLNNWLTILVVLGRCELCSYWELHLALQCVIRSNGFSHVFYRLWPIGMTTSHLEVITRRCRTWITWLWPGGMN